MGKNFSSVLVCSAFALIASFAVVTRSAVAQQTTASNSMSRQDDRVQTSATHHYQSPAERAKDDLLITQVKSDLAKDGVGDNYPVAVDCDHGQIRLSGVIGSALEARHAGDIAARAPGVVTVVNRLTWRK